MFRSSAACKQQRGSFLSSTTPPPLPRTQLIRPQPAMVVGCGGARRKNCPRQHDKQHAYHFLIKNRTQRCRTHLSDITLKNSPGNKTFRAGGGKNALAPAPCPQLLFFARVLATLTRRCHLIRHGEVIKRIPKTFARIRRKPRLLSRGQSNSLNRRCTRGTEPHACTARASSGAAALPRVAAAPAGGGAVVPLAEAVAAAGPTTRMVAPAPRGFFGTPCERDAAPAGRLGSAAAATCATPGPAAAALVSAI